MGASLVIRKSNFSFVFSGVKIPIHPLDANMNGTDLGLSFSNGDSACFGSVGIIASALCAILTVVTVPTGFFRQHFWFRDRATLRHDPRDGIL